MVELQIAEKNIQVREDRIFNIKFKVNHNLVHTIFEAPF